MKLSEAAIRRRLDTWPVARLATSGPDGAPHQVPIVFAHQDGRLWSPIDGKPKPGGELTRVRNVRERPAVSVLLDDYGEDWSRLWWIRLDGHARVVQPEAPDRDPALAAVLEALRAKYPQYAESAWHFDETTYLRVRPVRVSAWAQSGSVDSIEASLRDN